jgi:hypothetical protein
MRRIYIVKWNEPEFIKCFDKFSDVVKSLNLSFDSNVPLLAKNGELNGGDRWNIVSSGTELEQVIGTVTSCPLYDAPEHL